MSVRIQLDDSHTFYTNLDFISGRIILSLVNDENISAIVVKLEGESRTLLQRPTMQDQNYDRRRDGGIVMENHKILYKVKQVFPPASPARGPTPGLAYTLRPGRHEYPFRFKIPINNGCSDPNSQQMGPGSGFGGFGLGGLQQMQYRHVKKTLPPSLTGFPGEAEIRYYIKVTVQRPSLFKENRRSAVGFRFLPIEPPRPPMTSKEVYARRPYVFQAGGATYARKTSMFKKNPTPLSDTAPKGEVDARLPSPALLTCNEPLPLRILARKLNNSPEHIFLTSLSVHIFGHTAVRAQDVVRTEISTWVMMSMSGLSIPIGSPSDEIRKETVVDSSLWKHIPLPNTIAPSFNTCNLTRKYELEVRLGLGFGVPGEIQPQIINLPLRFQVEIYSGIQPPAALLSAMATRPTASTSTPTAAAAPSRPSDPAYPPQLAPGARPEDDAPPSYEDAIADGITIADGPRREYSGVTDVNAPGLDEKGGGRPPPGYDGGGGAGSGGGMGRGPIVR